MINPGFRCAGAAGVAAGLLLAGEAAMFAASGWTAERFAAPEQAMTLLAEGGGALRMAGLLGFAGLVVMVYLLVGLAAALAPRAPARAAGTLYLGLIGVAGHALVPLSLWTGIPAFAGMADAHAALAHAGWAGFAPVSDAAHGIGSLFSGTAMVLAGSALAGGAVADGAATPRVAGWLGVCAGAFTLATLLGVGTPFQTAGAALLPVALTLTILFRLTAGAALWRLSSAGSSPS